MREDSSSYKYPEGQLTSLRILRRWFESGNLIEKRLGIRRRIAESMSFGRFVAPRTRIRVSLFVARPSHNLQYQGARFA